MTEPPECTNCHKKDKMVEDEIGSPRIGGPPRFWYCLRCNRPVKKRDRNK